MTLTQIQRDGLDAEALDQVYTVGASGTDHYTFQGEGLNGTVNDPTLYLTRGKTYRFEKGSAHPLRIQSTQGASGTAYNTGVTNNGGTGTVIMEVQHDAPDVLYYQCTSHANMNGILYTVGALADSGVTTAKLADGAVTTAKIADTSITNAKMATNAITTSQIQDGQISTAKIADDAVTQAKIAPDAINGAKIADNAIDSEHYTNASIDAVHIANNTITASQIANDAVGTGELASNAVTNAKIADDAVTNAKIADSTIITANIADSQITDAKIASGISSSKLTGALPAISGASLTNLPGGGKVIRVIPVLSSGESTYWYYNQGNPWITTGAITNVPTTSRFLIFGRFELRQATQHNSVYSQASFGSGGGSVYGGGSDSTNNTSWRTTQFTAYDYASSSSNREYYFSVSSNGSNSTYGAKVRNAFILVLELDAS